VKIRVAVTATVLAAALAAFGACGGPANTGGTPEAGGVGASVTAAADGGGSDQASADEPTADDQMTDDGSADDQVGVDQTADDETADDGAVDQGAIDQPGADDDTGSVDPDAPGDPEFCQQLISAEKQLDAIDQSFSAGDMGSVTSAITADIGVFQKLTDAAPSEIAPSMQDIIDALTAAQTALGGGTPDASALSGMSNMTSDINALGNYVSENCAAYATAG
jgi:hypothetical protein